MVVILRHKLPVGWCCNAGVAVGWVVQEEGGMEEKPGGKDEEVKVVEGLSWVEPMPTKSAKV